MRPLSEELVRRLDELTRQGLHRTLATPQGIDFSSNDYLGLARDPRLRESMLRLLRDGTLTTPASRLLSGTDPLHLELEDRLAQFKGTEAALLFPTGYQANIGLLTALLEPQDRAISDALNHASIIDGLRLSGARRVVVPHLDLEAVEAALAAPHLGGRTFVIVESLYSMDGDVAPLDHYAALAARHGAEMIVDDAHATGLYGPRRASGLVEVFGIERQAAAVVTTFGKALGVFGACVAGPRAVIDWLVQRSRPFIFTTAPPPLLLHAVRTALDLCAGASDRRQRVLELAGRLRLRLRAGGADCLRSEGPIVPVVFGANESALAAAADLRRRGFDVRAVRPPSVPEGTARLRIAVHANHREEDVDRLAAALLEIHDRSGRACAGSTER